jgi:hypothetical protein
VQDGPAAAEVDAGRRQVTQPLVGQGTIAVLNKGGDPRLQLSEQVGALKQDAALVRQVPALDLVLRLTKAGRAADAGCTVAAKLVRQITGEVCFVFVPQATINQSPSVWEEAQSIARVLTVDMPVQPMQKCPSSPCRNAGAHIEDVRNISGSSAIKRKGTCLTIVTVRRQSATSVTFFCFKALLSEPLNPEALTRQTILEQRAWHSIRSPSWPSSPVL